MQAPGGPDEDTSGDFKYGGWTVPYFDDALGAEMDRQMGKPFDLLLGRTTYEIFATYWPDHKEEGAGINNATKYVVSTEERSYDWEKTVVISENVVETIKELKAGDGPDIQVHGSAILIQTLLEHDLVDELWLKIFPVTLGFGKKLFGGGTMAAAWDLVDSHTTPSGVLIANYKRAGEIKTGSFGT